MFQRVTWLDLRTFLRYPLAMESSDSAKLKKLFSAQPSDLKIQQTARGSPAMPSCNCVNPNGRSKLGFHSEQQDTDCPAWKMLNELINAADSRKSKEFSPGLEMPPELWSQIITLPSSISKLKSVRKLYLYGSYLVRIPPEIGDMADLEELDLYTSYRLHWLPYEVTNCSKLKRSRISTRALYGNYKYRPPFPQLNRGMQSANTFCRRCSVCRQDVAPTSLMQVWISALVATDVLPLLVNACSDQCVRRLPAPAFGYVGYPHTGGLQLSQPPPEFVPPRQK
jgi:hypothetical protein